MFQKEGVKYREREQHQQHRLASYFSVHPSPLNWAQGKRGLLDTLWMATADESVRICGAAPQEMNK
jgi:hypothetical protein